MVIIAERRRPAVSRYPCPRTVQQNYCYAWCGCRCAGWGRLRRPPLRISFCVWSSVARGNERTAECRTQPPHRRSAPAKAVRPVVPPKPSAAQRTTAPARCCVIIPVRYFRSRRFSSSVASVCVSVWYSGARTVSRFVCAVYSFTFSLSLCLWICENKEQRFIVRIKRRKTVTRLNIKGNN